MGLGLARKQVQHDNARQSRSIEATPLAFRFGSSHRYR